MPVNVVYNKAHFDKALADAGSNLVVIEFTAEFCNASRNEISKTEQLSAKNPSVVFIKTDAEKCRDVSDPYNITSLPTFIFLKEGKQVDRMDYSLHPELVEKVEKHK